TGVHNHFVYLCLSIGEIETLSYSSVLCCKCFPPAIGEYCPEHSYEETPLSALRSEGVHTPLALEDCLLQRARRSDPSTWVRLSGLPPPSRKSRHHHSKLNSDQMSKRWLCWPVLCWSRMLYTY